MKLRVHQCLTPAAKVCALMTMLLGVPAVANAATANTTFSVTATVIATCSVSATTVAFGSYSTAQLDSTGTLSVTCTNTTPYTVALDAGVGAGATVAARKMTGPGGQLLTYSLYHDAARSSVWGATVGTDTTAGTGTGSLQSLTVYGRIPAAQSPTPGAYSDTITVTVAY